MEPKHGEIWRLKNGQIWLIIDVTIIHSSKVVPFFRKIKLIHPELNDWGYSYHWGQEGQIRIPFDYTWTMHHDDRAQPLMAVERLGSVLEDYEDDWGD